MNFKISKILKPFFLKSVVGMFAFISLNQIHGQDFSQNPSSLHENDPQIAARDGSDRQNRREGNKDENRNQRNWDRDSNDQDERHGHRNYDNRYDVNYQTHGGYYGAPNMGTGYQTSSSRYVNYPPTYYNRYSTPVYPTGYAGKIYDYNHNWHNREWHEHENKEWNGNRDHGNKNREHEQGKGKSGDDHKDGNRRNDDGRKGDDH